MNRAKHSKTERDMVNYLLGAMTEAARAEFETRYFADDELFEQLMIVKEELLDAYARGQLSQDERARFEAHLLNSPRQREQVAFARALRQQLAAPISVASAPSAPPASRLAGLNSWSPRAWAWSTAALLLLLVGMGWLLRENRKLQVELATLRAEQAARLQHSQRLEDELAALRATTPVPTRSPSPTPAPSPAHFDNNIVAIELRPETRGSGGAAPTVKLPLEAGSLSLRLRLNFAPVAGSPSAILFSPAGRPLKNYRHLRARRDQTGYFIDLRVAASALKAGAYRVILRGRNAEENEDIQLDYPLKIERP